MPCGMNLGLELEALRRVYRTRDLRDTVHVEDEVHLDVAVLPVLPDAAMRAILREALREGGWRDGADGTLEKSFGATTATLSADGTRVTLRVRGSADVAASGRAAVEGDGGEEGADREAERRAREAMERRSAEERQRLAGENVKELARQEPALRGEVQAALNRTYRRALEDRAKQLGELESVREREGENGSYEVTVVVKA